MGQDTVQAGTFWGVLNVLLHASGAQFGWDILTGAPTGNVLIQTDTFSSLTGVPTDLLDSGQSLGCEIVLGLMRPLSYFKDNVKQNMSSLD